MVRLKETAQEYTTSFHKSSGFAFVLLNIFIFYVKNGASSKIIKPTLCIELQIDLSGIYSHAPQSYSQYSEWKPCNLIKVRNYTVTDDKVQCWLGEGAAGVHSSGIPDREHHSSSAPTDAAPSNFQKSILLSKKRSKE